MKRTKQNKKNTLSCYSDSFGSSGSAGMLSKAKPIRRWRMHNFKNIAELLWCHIKTLMG